MRAKERRLRKIKFKTGFVKVNQDYDVPETAEAFEFFIDKAKKAGHKRAAKLARQADAYGMTPEDVAKHADLLDEIDLEPEDVTPIIIHHAEEIHRQHTDWIRAWIRNFNSKNGHSVVDITDTNADIRKARAQAEASKRPKVLGFPATAVVRYMGKEGYSIDEVKKVLETSGIDLADSTIAIQHRAGKTGERGPPAPLTKSQEDKLLEMMED